MQKFKTIFSKYPVLTAYLFGSQATGKASKSSDYDFAVLLSGKIKPDKYFNYKLALTGDLLNFVDSKFIDLIILNNKNISALLKFNIIKHGKIIYEKDKNARKNLEFKIMRNWYDQQYFENLWHTIFIKNMAQGKFL